jgi:signal peptidase I
MNGGEIRRRRKTRDSTVGTVLVVVVAAIAVRTFILDAAVVEGKSMLPHYRNDSVVLILKTAYGIRSIRGKYVVCWRLPERGDVVAAQRPDSQKMVIKRIGEIRGDTGAPEYFLIGDNAIESIDSRDFGPVPLDAVVGKVIPQR